LELATIKDIKKWTYIPNIYFFK